MIAWSTFAARICPSDRCDEVERTKAVRRGRYAFTYRGLPAVSTAAQSPVQMTRNGSWGVTKAVSARTRPSAVSTSH